MMKKVIIGIMVLSTLAFAKENLERLETLSGLVDFNLKNIKECPSKMNTSSDFKGTIILDEQAKLIYGNIGRGIILETCKVDDKVTIRYTLVKSLVK